MATAVLRDTLDAGQTKYWAVTLDDGTAYIVVAADSASAITAATTVQTANNVITSNIATLKAQALTAINTNVTYEALATPSTVQNTAQIQALSRQTTGVIRLLLNQVSSLAGT